MIDNIKNVPEIYTKRSRDYQLLLKLLDVVTNSVKFNIDKVTDIYDSFLCNDRFLDFLATIYNFNPQIQFTDEDLRYMLSGFGSMMKNKGTKKGIEQAISLVMRTQKIHAEYTVVIYNNPKYVESLNDTAASKDPTTRDYAVSSGKIAYYIELRVGDNISKAYLDELLEYVRPIGYTVDVVAVKAYDSDQEIQNSSIIRYFINPGTGKGNSNSSIVSGQEMVSRVSEDLSEYTYENIANNSSPSVESDVYEGNLYTSVINRIQISRDIEESEKSNNLNKVKKDDIVNSFKKGE